MLSKTKYENVTYLKKSPLYISIIKIISIYQQSFKGFMTSVRLLVCPIVCTFIFVQILKTPQS